MIRSKTVEYPSSGHKIQIRNHEEIAEHFIGKIVLFLPMRGRAFHIDIRCANNTAMIRGREVFYTTRRIKSVDDGYAIIGRKRYFPCPGCIGKHFEFVNTEQTPPKG